MLTLLLLASIGQQPVCASGQCLVQQRAVVQTYSSTYTSYVEAPVAYGAAPVARLVVRPVRGAARLTGRVVTAPFRLFRGGCR